MKNTMCTPTAMVALALLAVAGAVCASPVCRAAKEDGITASDLKRVLTQQGYLVKTVRIDQGCYEVYGLDPLGRRIQKHFDPATGKPVVETPPQTDIPG